LSVVICPSVWPLDQAEAMAALTGGLVLENAVGSGQACARLFQPSIGVGQGLLANYSLESTDDFPCLDEERHATFDCRHRDGLGFGETVPTDGQEPRDGARGGSAALQLDPRIR
jgi:hypothetical protein